MSELLNDTTLLPRDAVVVWLKRIVDFDGSTVAARQLAQRAIDLLTDRTLRDYFAAAVLPAVLRDNATGETGVPCLYSEQTVAKQAYAIADAMLAEREKGSRT